MPLSHEPSKGTPPMNKLLVTCLGLLLLGVQPIPAAEDDSDDVNVPDLINKLQSENPTRRSRAAAGLVKAGAKAAPALGKTVKDTNPLVRGQAIHILGLIGPDAKEAVPALVEALKDKEPDVSANASLAL